MAQYFYINHGSTLPSLRMELIYDGKYDFMKSAYFYAAIQNADVTFSMWDEHGVLKISDAPANIVLVDQGTCEERYILEYKWLPKNTRKPGSYKGQFKITFNDDIVMNDVVFDKGDLIVPIYEDVIILIKE